MTLLLRNSPTSSAGKTLLYRLHLCDHGSYMCGLPQCFLVAMCITIQPSRRPLQTSVLSPCAFITGIEVALADHM
ncbi:hypothetical protein AMECASPLE_002734 [Ameca splendens]|uniref:Uncharacterized protein n=1 Tax=Ameca splendens TaxID=208324 RepID=A0ABV0ZV16_9TELE